MSTLDETVSMLEAMPEDARIKVMEFTQRLFTSRKTCKSICSSQPGINPF